MMVVTKFAHDVGYKAGLSRGHLTASSVEPLFQDELGCSPSPRVDLCVEFVEQIEEMQIEERLPEDEQRYGGERQPWD